MNVIFLHSSRNKRTNYILHVTISYISLVITQSLILMQLLATLRHGAKSLQTVINNPCLCHYLYYDYFKSFNFSSLLLITFNTWKKTKSPVILTTKSWSHMLLEKVQKRQQNLLSICNMKIYGRVAKYSLWVWRATTNLPSWRPQSQEILT